MKHKKSRRVFSELTPADVKWRLEDGVPVPANTAEVLPAEEIIGQSRALKALRLGLELYSPGYNVFVCGITGNGRTSTVQRLLKGMQPACALAADLAYVFNFDEPDRPMLLTLSRSRAAEFREQIHRMMRSMREEIPAIVNSETLHQRRRELRRRFQSRTAEILQTFEERAVAAGFDLLPTKVDVVSHYELLYRIGEQHFRISELEELVEAGALAADEATRIQDAYESLQSSYFEAMAEQQRQNNEFNAAVDRTEREAVKVTVDSLVQLVAREFADDKIRRWLQVLSKAVLENLQFFRRPDTEAAKDSTAPDEETPPPASEREQPEVLDLSVFDVNIVLTSKDSGCPVVIENHPTPQNLFGSQDRVPIGPGMFGTDFMRIKPGSLLRAQGGYLILNAADVLIDPLVWTQLKRTLRSRELIIQPPDLSPTTGMTVLNPEPIPLNVKVILLGNAFLYEQLIENDPDFAKIFKIKADFDTDIECTNTSIPSYVQVLVRILREDSLRDMDRSALEEVLQYSMRLAGKRGRLTTRFSTIADLLREADFLAGKEGSHLIEGRHIGTAVHDYWERHNLIEEKLGTQIAEGVIRISLSGQVVGQVNGLTVLETGSYAFGKPARITCRTAAGKSGFVSIEREAELSGNIHQKGMLILQGFLAGRYGQLQPLTLFATLCFEQSYGYIDGDSATSAEIYVVMSSLSNVPLRQDLAVTGSMDQFGHVQPVGGINEKIEGFFRTCKSSGLTATQGVLIPRANCAELTLAAEVVNAVRAGLFHIYPIDTIDDGIELLSGVVAGKIEKDGEWTPGSINSLVAQRIAALNLLAQRRDDPT